MASPFPERPLLRAVFLAVLLAALIAGGAEMARGERTQKDNVVLVFNGELSPSSLPRDRLAPVALHLEGGLYTDDGGPLPRTNRLELELPAQGALTTRGLPLCPQRQLRNARPPEALASCRDALIGRGRLKARIAIPNQTPFWIDARLLAFNGRVGGGRAVIVYAYAADPPTVAVVPFAVRRQSGRFGRVLAANLPAALGPWPRLARFELTLSRRYSFRGKSYSYLRASCPAPPRNTAAYFSLARASLTLASGKQIAQGIARSCRAR
jgi:hypothetical protein